MPIAIGPNIEDGLYNPYTQTIIYEGTGSSQSTGSTTSSYKPKSVATAKLEAGGGVGGAPKKRKTGAMVSTHDPEVIAALFGGGEF